MIIIFTPKPYGSKSKTLWIQVQNFFNFKGYRPRQIRHMRRRRQQLCQVKELRRLYYDITRTHPREQERKTIGRQTYHKF